MSDLTATEKLLLELFDIGAVSFDGPFKFKIHEKYPDFPLSPNKIVLRTPENGGRLTPDLVAQIGHELWKKLLFAGLKFDLVAGLPRAGEPLTEVVARFAGRPLVKLLKKEKNGRRCIHSVAEGNYHPGQKIVLVDDVITQAKTKEEAIRACEAAGLIVLAILVFIDRGEGGSDYLQSLGYRIISVCVLSQLIDFYFHERRISRGKADESHAFSQLAKKIFLEEISSIRQ